MGKEYEDQPESRSARPCYSSRSIQVPQGCILLASTNSRIKQAELVVHRAEPLCEVVNLCVPYLADEEERVFAKLLVEHVAEIDREALTEVLDCVEAEAAGGFWRYVTTPMLSALSLCQLPLSRVGLSRAK